MEPVLHDIIVPLDHRLRKAMVCAKLDIFVLQVQPFSKGADCVRKAFTVHLARQRHWATELV